MQGNIHNKFSSQKEKSLLRILGNLNFGTYPSGFCPVTDREEKSSPIHVAERNPLFVLKEGPECFM
nr:MAG TPA_asm: hypothetical protein [Caudoviricetes sp.]